MHSSNILSYVHVALKLTFHNTWRHEPTPWHTVHRGQVCIALSQNDLNQLFQESRVATSVELHRHGNKHSWVCTHFNTSKQSTVSLTAHLVILYVVFFLNKYGQNTLKCLSLKCVCQETEPSVEFLWLLHWMLVLDRQTSARPHQTVTGRAWPAMYVGHQGGSREARDRQDSRAVSMCSGDPE